MADQHRSQLAAVFSPPRLAAIHALYFAWLDRSDPPTSASLLGLFENDVAAPLYDLCYADALVPLSEVPLSKVPPLLSFLPASDSPGFPVQALGLHVLLDQAPRHLLRGADERWTFGFFGELTLRLARELAALPAAGNPQRVHNWRALGYSFEAAWLRAFLLLTAFIHAEDPGAQCFGQDAVERECRRGAEAHYREEDPTRELDQADSSDVTLFARMRVTTDNQQTTPPQHGAWTLCRIVRAHEPIIRAFGRYPYRNGALGREEREGEAEFLRDTGGFEASDPETTRKVREDVVAGRHAPLQATRLE